MDFITGLPTIEGKYDIFVIVDGLTKYAHFIGISSKAKASQVADSYVKNIFKLHGFSKVIVSDWDPKLWLGYQVHKKLLEGTISASWNILNHEYFIPSPNRWTKWGG